MITSHDLIKMAKRKVPNSRFHPSQSSVEVPNKLKEEIKEMQDKRCWLCDQKAHKKHRPLEICHIYPQARSWRNRVDYRSIFSDMTADMTADKIVVYETSQKWAYSNYQYP